MRNCRKTRACILLLTVILSCLFLGACGREGSDKRGIKLYYLNSDGSGLEDRNYTPRANTREAIVDELLGKLSVPSDDVNQEAPITGFMLLSSEMTGKVVTLNFSSEYNDMATIEEILTRSAIVDTLCSFSEVDSVFMEVEGQPLTDDNGEEVGLMSSEQFIYNSDTEIRNYEKVQLHLFFANRTGDKLVDAFRNVVYNSNLPMERLVVEQVVAGPNADFAYPTVNPETKVISVTTRDNICYVNMSSEFQSQPNDVTAQVAIYSIVNSLCELPNVDMVQIAVNGQPDAVFMDTLSLTGTFQMNEDIIEPGPAEEENASEEADSDENSEAAGAAEE